VGRSSIKLRGHEVYHSGLSRDEVENEWSYTSTAAVCLLGLYGDNFTHAFYLHLEHHSITGAEIQTFRSF
jgi:fatty acid desaturase